MEGESGRDYKFYLGSNERYIFIESNFDSGNIRCVRQISDFTYRLQSVEDGLYTGYPVTAKSWFYFKASGFPSNVKAKFLINRLHALQSFCYSKPSIYRPVFSRNKGPWMPLPQAALTCKEDGDVECIIEHTFKNPQQIVEFAFSYPYTYTRHLAYLDSLQGHSTNAAFYYHMQIMTHSPQSRPIHLLTITSHDHQDLTRTNQFVFNPLLFPEKNRALRFKKPVVLVTARVHPGQTPASHALEGVVNFLTNQTDLRAELLRKMFVFMIVPMINVDGVYNGHFRMDCFGNNLNRYYLSPDPAKQPAVYAIKQLTKHLASEGRLCFYFDLHAHHGCKGCFIYGNAINDFVEQVQSQVFCKLFAMNHSGFNYEQCNFSEKQMNAKDQSDLLTKEGCGRVVMYRTARIIHSYSLECGLLIPHPLARPLPANPEFILGSKGMPHQREVLEGMFTEEAYRDIGRSMLVTVLDVFDKNPYGRVYGSQYANMDNLRRLTAFEVFHQADRFRMFEKFVFGKVKNINSLIRHVLNSKLHYNQLHHFYFFHDSHLKQVVWPTNIPGLIPPQTLSPMKKIKSVSERSRDSIPDAVSLKVLKIEANVKEEDESSDEGSLNGRQGKETVKDVLHLLENQSGTVDQLLKKDLSLEDLARLEAKFSISSNLSTNDSPKRMTPFRHRPKRIPIRQISEQSQLQDLDTAQIFRKNIYETIKQQIKMGLQKERQKRRKAVHMFRRQKVNSSKEGKSKSKLCLPSLGTGITLLANCPKI